MANPNKRLPENVPGDFFVDSTCIDCDTCRQVAPLVFAAADGHSYVQLQPDASALTSAAHALLCCPTASIGARSRHARAAVAAAVADFPLPIAEGVWSCGFNAAGSFGAHSYLLHHPQGHWLIDSPRWQPQLARSLADLGGVARIFLTHRDDVADAQRYARHFSAQVVIHELDADAYPHADRLIHGQAVQQLAEGLQCLPLSGHTAGSMALLAHGRYLFSGDHLWWSRTQGRLAASRSACWHSWSEQCASMRRLAELPFTWVLPGHGERIALDPAARQRELAGLIMRMEQPGDPDG